MTKRIILAGGGHAHLAVLADWSRRPPEGTERILVTPNRHTAYSGMLPGWIAGHYRASELLIDLQPLAKCAGARLLLAEAVGLDAESQVLSLSNGDRLEYDLLSLATGGEINVSQLAALGDRLLAIRPVDTFMTAWSRFMETSAGLRSPHVAVVGGGAAGVELALAAKSVLSQFSHGRVTIITPEDGFLSGHATGVISRARTELAQRAITLCHAEAAGQEDGLLLSDGSFLAADLVIAATGSRAPRWLASSGLACSEQGFVSVGANLRSASHSAIFAAGDIVERIDRTLPRSGVHAVKAGPVLAANLHAALNGGPLREYQPNKQTLYLLATGDRRAILSWGGFSATGRLAWRLKDWIDRMFVANHNDAEPPQGVVQ